MEQYHLKRLVCLILCLWFLGKTYLYSQSTYKQSEFIIGTICEPILDSVYKGHPYTLGTNDSIRYRMIKNAHFNLLHSRYQDVRYVLKLAHNAGLKLRFQCGEGMVGRIKAQSFDYEETFYGIQVADEPPIADFNIIQARMKEVLDAFPNKLAYINMEGGDGSGDGFNIGRSLFENTLEKYVNPPSPSLQPNVVSFDYYPFADTYCRDSPATQGGIDFSRVKLEHYFYNLSTVRKKAGNRPMWVTLLSSDHSVVTNYNSSAYSTRYGSYGSANCVVKLQCHIDYRKLLFMSFCPIAYGVKGLTYFTYAKMDPTLIGWDSNIVDSINDIFASSQRYQEVKNINYYIEKIVGPVVMNTTWLGAFHKTNLPTNEFSLAQGQSLQDELLTSTNNQIILDVSENDILFGIFKKDTSYLTSSDSLIDYYLWIVNKNIAQPHNAVVVDLRGWNWTNASSAPRVGDISSPYAGNTNYKELNRSQLSGNTSPTSGEGQYFTRIIIDSLVPGEGRLLKLTKSLKN